MNTNDEIKLQLKVKELERRIRKERNVRLYTALSNKLSKLSEKDVKDSIRNRNALIRNLIDKKKDEATRSVIKKHHAYFNEEEKEKRWL